MKIFHLIALSLGALSFTAAGAAPITIYDGNASPTAQGWTRLGGGGTEAVGSGTTVFETTTIGFSSQLNNYTYMVGEQNFITSIRLQVFSAGLNPYDAGLGFSVIGNPNSGLSGDRHSNLMIGQNEVMWGDQSGGSVAVDTSVFHEYAFRYLNGNLDVFLDASYEDIKAGTAVAILSKTSVVPWTIGYSAGVLVFGDNTNDLYVDSRYAVDFVNFERLDALNAVPEPGTLAIVGLGLACLGLSRRPLRRQACAAAG